MPVAFVIPGPLRPWSGGAKRVEVAASPASAGEALELLWQEHPGLRDRVMNERGEVRQHVNVFVGVESIRFTGGLATPVPAGAEIAIVPAVSGG